MCIYIYIYIYTYYIAIIIIIKTLLHSLSLIMFNLRRVRRRLAVHLGLRHERHRRRERRPGVPAAAEDAHGLDYTYIIRYTIR